MIKNLLLFLCFYQLMGNTYSQSMNKVDEKYGLNKFKLESSITLYKNNLKQINYDGEVKFYNYTGTDIKTIFNYKVKEIILGYFESKLYYVAFKFYNNDELFNSSFFYENLKDLYGKGKLEVSYKTGDYEYDWGYYWQGKKTYLRFDKSKSGDITLWLISETMKKEILNKEL